MSLSFTLVLLVLILLAVGLLTKKLNIVKFKENSHGTLEFDKINLTPVTIVFITIVLALVQPMDWFKVEVGHKGLLINLLGDKRGASSTEEVSGVIFFNKYTQEVQEIPLDQRHIEYEKQNVVAKGGYPCDIKPSFNYSVNQANASDMFTNLRSTYKSGQLEAVEKGWLANAIIGAINDVANRYQVDYLFNNREKFEAEIVVEVNKRAGKWFTVSQLKTNIQPPSSIKNSIEAKAKADADALTAEAQAKVATADARRKTELARGDSAALVINASSEALAIKLKMREITPTYVDYVKWNNANSKVPRVPSTVLGSSSNVLLSR